MKIGGNLGKCIKVDKNLSTSKKYMKINENL